MTDNNPPPYNVLFLCTHNSARSVIAECVMNRLGAGRFRGFSAGSTPSGAINPHALDLLRQLNYDVSQLRSKSWEEFAQSGAPKMHFVLTVCDDAAAETCPVWPGHPMTAHWGVEDPSRAQGTEVEKRLAFADTHRLFTNRIGIFVNLPVATLSEMAMQKQLDDLGNRNAQTT
jgi:arsenate reductase (thioredoxin)